MFLNYTNFCLAWSRIILKKRWPEIREFYGTNFHALKIFKFCGTNFRGQAIIICIFHRTQFRGKGKKRKKFVPRKFVPLRYRKNFQWHHIFVERLKISIQAMWYTRFAERTIQYLSINSMEHFRGSYCILKPALANLRLNDIIVLQLQLEIIWPYGIDFNFEYICIWSCTKIWSTALIMV